MRGGTAAESDCHQVLVGSGGAMHRQERERERERERWEEWGGKRDKRVATTCTFVLAVTIC